MSICPPLWRDDVPECVLHFCQVSCTAGTAPLASPRGVPSETRGTFGGVPTITWGCTAGSVLLGTLYCTCTVLLPDCTALYCSVLPPINDTCEHTIMAHMD